MCDTLACVLTSCKTRSFDNVYSAFCYFTPLHPYSISRRCTTSSPSPGADGLQIIFPRLFFKEEINSRPILRRPLLKMFLTEDKCFLGMCLLSYRHAHEDISSRPRRSRIFSAHSSLCYRKNVMTSNVKLEGHSVERIPPSHKA